MTKWRVIQGDCREVLRSLRRRSVHTIVTSPPYYGLRDYGGQDLQIGLEKSPDEYVDALVAVFGEAYDVLRDDGTLWLNLGDSYARPRAKGHRGPSQKQDSNRGTPLAMPTDVPEGIEEKELLGIPWMMAFALRRAGWLLRQEIIWHKPNPMTESVRDRCTRSHEHIFLLVKQPIYFCDMEAIKEASKTEGVEIRSNKRSVWTIAKTSYKEAHFAVFPEELAETCILAGTSKHGVCRACGTPWWREIESERVPTRPGLDTKATERAMVQGNRDPQRHVTATRTVGWRPGCDCGRAAEIVPAVVLDTFAGSGTALAVAVRHARRAIGIELNPEYIPLIEKRMLAAEMSTGFGFGYSE